MTSSLSAYWVKFFKGAGFPQDVATKHAVVFSNNRIKPDMLPDLDKPSLKEMGITLMGDMIAILRYAKKVVEETTCERFLVDSEDLPQTASTAKPIVKKVVLKPSKTSVSSKVKTESTNSVKSAKASSVSVVKTVPTKKAVPATKGSTISSSKERQVSIKRKIVEDEESFNECDKDEWSPTVSKKAKTSTNSKDDNKVGYTVILPKGSTTRSQQILKKSIEQKRTVFDRLGDSSVTSTTNSPESCPTFNVTGLGKEVYKRSVSVFNRLGDKDTKRDMPQIGILKNGTSNSTSQSILKNRSSNTSSIVTKKVVTKPAATMRADLEDLKNLNRAKRIGTTMKKLILDDASPSSTKVIKSNVTSGKLASERLTLVPAKARLGIAKSNSAKQVTFNRVATVTHVKKPDVFSRLGI